MRFIVFILILFVQITNLFSQPMKVSVEDILSNPGKYNGNAVEIEGTVEQYVKATAQTTSYYLVKGYYGGVIKINTIKSAPVINQKYKIMGIVYIDPLTRDPFISEQDRQLIEESKGPEIIIKEKSSPLTKLLYVLFVILLLLFLGMLIYQRFYQKRLPITSNQQQEIQPLPSPEKSVDSATELKTVKIQTAPKTMKFIPGQLEIISGEDKGKAFKIAGYPTPEGTIVTIGRTKVSGERAYAHIELGDQYRTVSRQQAEIIQKDKKIYIKNLSEVNYTRVNGKELAPGEMVELHDGAIIQMGELELQYKL